jgi:DNA-binding response OmpR family regulator
MSKTILIVEDEIDIREAMAEALTQAGYTVLTAENGAVGLKTALEAKPDLILVDIVMPVMDGHGLLSRLREDSWGKSAKVIVLTSMDDVKNIASAHEGHIDDYIIKVHTSLSEVVNKVRMLLI